MRKEGFFLFLLSKFLLDNTYAKFRAGMVIASSLFLYILIAKSMAFKILTKLSPHQNLTYVDI